MIPKGENKETAMTWLTDNGIEVPTFEPRCLHS